MPTLIAASAARSVGRGHHATTAAAARTMSIAGNVRRSRLVSIMPHYTVGPLHRDDGRPAIPSFFRVHAERLAVVVAIQLEQPVIQLVQERLLARIPVLEVT